MQHQNKVALVTGGSRGIGAATAIMLAKAGYDVVITYRQNSESATAVTEQIHALGQTATAIQIDFADASAINGLFEQVDTQFGRLDALVNNAGILQQQTRVSGLTAERINHIMQVNVTAPLLCCQQAIKRMSTELTGHGGSIVNVSSAASRIGAAGEYVDYAASKGALDTLTTGLALEVAAEGIRINAVRPGFIETDMHRDGGEPDRVARLAPIIPMKRGGTADEVAEAIVWLLSDKASYSTGSFIDLAGGR